MNEPGELTDSSLTAPDDRDLMQRIANGDQLAFEILLRSHEDKVYALAFRMLGSREDARDVAQEVFLKIWEKPEGWQPKYKFTTWLYRVTTNQALNRIRKQELKTFLSLSSSLTPETKQLHSDNNPALETIQREQSAVFERQFNLLPPRQRAALHLRYVKSLSVSDVAKSMGVSLKSAESLIFRGKSRLRENVKDM